MLAPDVRVLKSAARRFAAPRVRAIAQPKIKLAAMALRGRIPEAVSELAPVTPRLDRAEVEAEILREAVERSLGGSQADTIRSLSEERIIGRSDIRDLSSLEVGIAVARGVARINIAGGSGSGCLVAPRILLTNHHVIPNRDVAGVAQFDVQDDASGQQMPRHDYALLPGFFFFTLKELDVTLVGLAETSSLNRPIDMYPWLQIQGADLELVDRDAITIIQHPLGGLKQIALSNNEVILVAEKPPRFIHYTTDTQPGSSGAPCFDNGWRLVALHHSGVPETDKAGNILKRDGQVFQEKRDPPDSIKWIANEGVRMSAIMEALKHAHMTGDQVRLRDEMFSGQPPNPVVLSRAAGAALPPPSSSSPSAGPGRPRRPTAETPPPVGGSLGAISSSPQAGGPSSETLQPVGGSPVPRAPRPQAGGPSSETPRPAGGSRAPLTARPQPGERRRETPREGGVPMVLNISANEIGSVHIGGGDAMGGLAPRELRPRSQGAQRPSVAPVSDDVVDGENDFDVESDNESDSEDEVARIDPDWKDREGYDPMFLGEKVPLPGLSRDQRRQSAIVPSQYLREGGDEYVFDYHHFSLAFNKQRRFAWYSAANVDGDRRAYKTKRGRDKWSYDPRMDDPRDPTLEVGEELYAGNDTDRGHLTRYLDVQWGDTLAETMNATNDTFHFSNCVLQLSAFNQGKERWQGIEQFLLEHKARPEKRRMIVFTGPVFRTTDPIYRNEKMDYSIRIPLSFWKVCVLAPRDGRKLSATAFQLGQPDIVQLSGFEERFDVTATQITIRQLAQITGLDFGRLKRFDHYAKTGEGALEVDRTGVLNTLDDIIV